VTYVVALLLRIWDSSWFRSLVVLVVGVALLWAFYAWGSRVGQKRAHADDAITYQAALAKADAKYREQERVHEQKVSDLRVEYAKTEAAARASDAVVSRDLADGTRRLRFKAATCRPSAPALGPTPGRADGAADAELAPEVATALYAITADGDQAIRQLIALQAWAKAAVRLCGATQ
jgi:hypothetical protein